MLNYISVIDRISNRVVANSGNRYPDRSDSRKTRPTQPVSNQYPAIVYFYIDNLNR